MEQQDNIIILEDENGDTVECAVIDVFDFKGSRYVALMETAELEKDEADVIMMKIQMAESEEDSQLIGIDDDDELQEAFDEFVRRDEEYSEEE